jgi:hypothetical protein
MKRFILLGIIDPENIFNPKLLGVGGQHRDSDGKRKSKGALLALYLQGSFVYTSIDAP